MAALRRPIRVLLADDHALVRAGLRLTLADEPDIVVIGEATTGDEAITRCEELLPDVLLLDLKMPGPEPEESVATIRSREHAPRIVVVTAFDDTIYVRELMQRGIVGYILKDEPPEAVVAAVRAAARGGTRFSPALAARLAEGQPVRLTARDRELLRLLAAGWRTREIAERAHLGEQTTRNYLSRLYAKLGVPNHTAAATWAREHGLP